MDPRNDRKLDRVNKVMKLQKNRKDNDHIYNNVYSKMKLLQPSGIHIENIKIPSEKPRDTNKLFTVTQQVFAVK